ncbi:MAG: DUF5657 family protein [Patescibacteria group bacterium]
MPVPDVTDKLLDNFDPGVLLKLFLVLFVIFYAVFSLILYRQIQIMTKRLPTQLSPLLRFIAIVNIGVSLAVLFLIVGNF